MITNRENQTEQSSRQASDLLELSSHQLREPVIRYVLDTAQIDNTKHFASDGQLLPITSVLRTYRKHLDRFRSPRSSGTASKSESESEPSLATHVAHSVLFSSTVHGVVLQNFHRSCGHQLTGPFGGEGRTLLCHGLNQSTQLNRATSYLLRAQGRSTIAQRGFEPLPLSQHSAGRGGQAAIVWP